MASFSKFFVSILNIGIGSQTLPDDAKRIKIVNGISFLGGAILLLTTIAINVLLSPFPKIDFKLANDFFFGSPEKIEIARDNFMIIFPVLDFFFACFCFIILILNHYKKFNLATFLLCFGATIYAAFFIMVGGIKVVFFFFPPALLPIIFYKKKYQYFAFWLFNLSVFFSVASLMNHFNIFYFIPAPEAYFSIFIVNSLFTFSVLFLIVNHFKNQNIKSEEMLKQQNDTLKSLADEVVAQRDELQLQKNKIEQQTHNMISSIVYAEKLQQAILPQSNILNNFFSDSFIFFSPRDIVSGDFYWIKKIDRSVIVAAVDCTGHGVPGALMSMLGISFMNEITSSSNPLNAGEIIDRLRGKVKTTLNQTSYENFQKDGMEMALCIIDLDSFTMQYAGAQNPLYIIRKNLQINDFASIEKKNVVEFDEKSLVEVKANKQPVAIGLKEVPFITHEIKLFKGDLIYLFTDGHIDQIGGEGLKKFSAKNFKQLLLENCHQPMQQQNEILIQTLNSWRRGHEQFDDMLIIGIKI